MSPRAILLTSLSHIASEHEAQEQRRTAPVPSTPEMVDVKRLDHLPWVGAMLRELAVKDTLDARIPPHERHAVTVGECIEALVLTMLTGEHA